MAALDRLGQAHFGLRHEDVAAILERIAEAVTHAAGPFEIDIGRQLDYEEILAQANADLVNLTLAAQRTAEADARQLAQVERRARHLESLNRQLAEKANRDPLTGVFNRGFFDRFLAEQFDRGRNEGTPTGLLLTDVHHFKRINDTFGHQQGDAVIVEVARRLRERTRDGDMVARYGGDEFVVVLPAADLMTVRQVAGRLRTAIWDRPFLALTGGALDVSIGIGAVCVTDYARAGGPAQVLAAADKLLYATKRLRDRKICLVPI